MTGFEQRQLRDRAAREGKCRTCRKRPPRPGLRTCTVCADNSRESDRRLEGLARQRLWNVCCQSTDEHRFDCHEHEGKRGPGPFGPVKAPTAAEMIARMRLEVTEPEPGVMLVREVPA